MNPHKLPLGYSYYTFDKSLAYAIAIEYGLRVDVYSLGDDRPRESMPYAVWTKDNGALLVNWGTLEVYKESI